jgi:hypothetical protein
MTRRLLIVRLLIAALMLASALGPVTGRAAATDDSISFSIGRGVSREDADYVMEGTRLAEHVLSADFGFETSETIHVSARQQGAPGNLDIVAASTGPSIIVYTGSPGWKESAPFERIGVIVHEYVHVFQDQALGGRDEPTASWFEEGLAEYVRTRAIVGLGLVKQADVDGYRAYILNENPPNFDLAEIERLSSFQSETPNVYDLSYFALSLLFEAHDLSTVPRYYAEIAGGTDWHDAFGDVFDETPAAFYDEFDSWKSGLVATTMPPDAYEPAKPIAVEAKVRLTKPAKSIDPGSQALFLALTNPQAICRWQIAYGDSVVPAAEHLTFADGVGRVFWLYALPREAPSGPATVTIDCGANAATGTTAIA